MVECFKTHTGDKKKRMSSLSRGL